jgi:ribose transport system ATP-binding protein
MDAMVHFQGVVKRFGATLAVDGVDMEVAPGEIRALLGANGAGKSTLIKLLAGVHEPDAGRILLQGRRIDHVWPRPPMAFIHQDLGLVDWMTVAENVALVDGFARRRGLIDWSTVRSRARLALQELGGDIDPAARVTELTRTERSIVAIARALAGARNIVVLDEPTASLHEREAAHLFEALRRLRGAGLAIVYVTHRLDEIFGLADSVTVMRDGRTVLTGPVSGTDPGQLVRAIVGRSLAPAPKRRSRSLGGPLLSVRGLRAGGVGPVSLDIRSGEIVGLTGLRGAGQGAVGRALAGALPIQAGSMALDGGELRPACPADAVARGVLFVTGDREAEALAMPLTVAENVFLNPGSHGRRTWRPRRRSGERRRAVELIHEFSIRPPDPDRPVATLSGGNQQKVVLARCLSVGGRLLVLEEPTMGVDVGARSDIYGMLRGAAESGAAVLLISTDLDEIARTCDRALVFDRGRIAGELAAGGLSVEALTALAGGVRPGARS